MTDETYNGWSNRETWATALHIDNDEGLHEYRNELCDTAWKAVATSYATVDQSRCYALAESLHDWVEEMSHDVYFPDSDHEPANRALCGMFHDIGSLWRVNWREIAENWLSDYEEAA